MEIAAGTPTKEITVQGVKLEVAQPYDAGHTLTENEAAALNQVLAENLRNNFGSKIRAAKDEANKAGTEWSADVDALQAEMDEYISKYEFGVRQSSGASTAHLDPVDKEVIKLARTAIKTALQNKGYKIKDVPKDKLEELVEQYRSANYEALHANAEQIVAAQNAVAQTSLENLDI